VRLSCQACPSCGNIFMEDAIFCRHCGAKRPEVEEEPQPGDDAEHLKELEWPDVSEEGDREIPDDLAPIAPIATADPPMMRYMEKLQRQLGKLGFDDFRKLINGSETHDTMPLSRNCTDIDSLAEVVVSYVTPEAESQKSLPSPSIPSNSTGTAPARSASGGDRFAEARDIIQSTLESAVSEGVLERGKASTYDLDQIFLEAPEPLPAPLPPSSPEPTLTISPAEVEEFGDILLEHATGSHPNQMQFLSGAEGNVLSMATTTTARRAAPSCHKSENNCTTLALFDIDDLAREHSINILPREPTSELIDIDDYNESMGHTMQHEPTRERTREYTRECTMESRSSSLIAHGPMREATADSTVPRRSSSTTATKAHRDRSGEKDVQSAVPRSVHDARLALRRALQGPKPPRLALQEFEEWRSKQQNSDRSRSAPPATPPRGTSRNRQVSPSFGTFEDARVLIKQHVQTFKPLEKEATKDSTPQIDIFVPGLASSRRSSSASSMSSMSSASGHDFNDWRGA